MPKVIKNKERRSLEKGRFFEENSAIFLEVIPIKVKSRIPTRCN
jgi:hypothetical protein